MDPAQPCQFCDRFSCELPLRRDLQLRWNCEEEEEEERRGEEEEEEVVVVVVQEEEEEVFVWNPGTL